MKRLAGTSRVALAVAAVLAALSLVSWRQGRALDTMAALDALRQEYSLEAADREELEGRIRYLESRGRVTAEAQNRLGMRRALASDIVFLPVGDS